MAKSEVVTSNKARCAPLESLFVRIVMTAPR
jgi:hypothetical protein